jgi:hypothetical protein
MNLRGKFMTDQNGQIRFRSVKPAGYPIPINGPVGDLLRAQGRHNMRPAHIHFMINKPGYKTQFSQVYSNDDPYLETDVQFGVTEALVGHYVKHDTATEPAPDPDVTGTWYSLEHTFVIEPGENTLPKPPITDKATGGIPYRRSCSGRRKPTMAIGGLVHVIETSQAPAHTGPVPQAVEAGGWIYVSAVFGDDPKSHAIPADPVKRQSNCSPTSPRS